MPCAGGTCSTASSINFSPGSPPGGDRGAPFPRRQSMFTQNARFTDHGEPRALAREAGATAAEEPPRGDRAYVAWVQASLNRLLGAGLAVDGAAGARTRAA